MTLSVQRQIESTNQPGVDSWLRHIKYHQCLQVLGNATLATMGVQHTNIDVAHRNYKLPVFSSANASLACLDAK